MKNNLQMIAALFSFQSRFASSSQDQDALRYGQKRLNVLAYIHDELYRLNHLDTIDLSLYHRRVLELVLGDHHYPPSTLMIEKEVSQAHIEAATAIGIAWVMHEMLTERADVSADMMDDLSIRVHAEHPVGETLALCFEVTCPPDVLRAWHSVSDFVKQLSDSFCSSFDISVHQTEEDLLDMTFYVHYHTFARHE